MMRNCAWQRRCSGPRRRRAPDGDVVADPFLLKLDADGGYQGAQFHALGAILKRVNVEIVKRSDQAQRFVVLPKRWIVERTFACLDDAEAVREGLGVPQSQGACLPQARFYPPMNSAKIMQFKMMFPDRLVRSPVLARRVGRSGAALAIRTDVPLTTI